MRFVLFPLLVVGCSSDPASAPDEPGPVLESGPGAIPANVETDVRFVTRMSGPKVGKAELSPHRTMQIWYSSNVAPILDAASFVAVPTGTVAVKKQDRDGNGSLEDTLTMVKGPPGSDPGAGDWQYGVVGGSADRAFCNGCHGGFKQTDFLGGTDVR